ncbi:Uncharacterised protein [Mycobacteroides abscessus subsp. abscessus]|nr:Uncharacterised protein [Mycobacteroides abscessus subsp. abscessus]
MSAVVAGEPVTAASYALLVSVPIVRVADFQGAVRLCGAM